MVHYCRCKAPITQADLPRKTNQIPSLGNASALSHTSHPIRLQCWCKWKKQQLFSVLSENRTITVLLSAWFLRGIELGSKTVFSF